MGANAFEYNVKLNLNAETKLAKAQIGELQKQLQDVSNLKLNFNGIEKLTDEINEASTAALKLQTNLQNALNPNTGTLDFSKFNNSITKSGESISGLAQSLLKLGPQGEKAFVSLAESISRSEVPLMRTNKLINGLWDNLKKTAGWQVSSSVIHGVMGQYQQAMGYAKALDKSLTDIRIVTGQSADQMARFAKEANAAAKKLSTTTTDYTNASLIYYQQGLSDAEVKKRSDITIKMANATGTNAQKVSDQLTSIWNNFDNGTKSLEHYADVMTALGAATASSTDEIAKGIQKFAAISDTVGLSYEYAASALATITATTRESADTVGNSLKTLFSRIQGLQLGETLDDGTTLNKYSTALAKVGISIKDNSGALKDMNSILDEMGTKWHTLAEDQQMALAQTVGGVRQYTQIMTLMENWDFFKENLNTANTATGALTMQAEIYADSWEAASQRMRASMESVWDTLIDSDSFKSLLNIGSTIIDGINSALAGIGGGSGVLATAAGIFGTVFKTQISQSLIDGIHTITHLTPKAMAAERQKRADTIDEMITTVNDPGATPYMGDYERQRTVDILRMQRDASEERSKRRSKMSSEAQAMDVELESSLNTLYDRRKSLAAEMDDYQAQIDRGRQAPEDDLTFFSESYDLQKVQPSSEAQKIQKDLNKARARKQSKDVARLETRLAEAKEQEVAEKEAQKNYDFGLALLRDADSGATAKQNASLGKVLEQLGIREANAEAQTTKIVTDLSSKREPGEYAIAEGKLIQRNKKGELLGGEAYSLFADLLGLTPDERAKFVKGEKLTDPTRQAVGNKLDASLKGLEKFIEEDLNKKGITDEQERSKLIGAYLQKTIGGIQSDALAGLGVNTTLKGMQRGGAMDIYQGAKGKRSVEIQDGNVEQAANKIKEQQDKLRQQNYASLTSAATGLVTGGFQTAAGMQGIKGAFNALTNGDIIGAMAGAGSAVYNLKTSRQNLSEAFSDLDPLSQNLKKQARKDSLLKQKEELEAERAPYEQRRKVLQESIKKSNELLESDTLSPEQRKLLKKQRKENAIEYQNLINEYDFKSSDKYLSNITSELKGLEDIKIGKFSDKLGGLGNALEFISKNADKAAGAFQAAQIAMKLTSEGLDYIYNENLRNATKAATTASELESAYAMNQRNHNALLASVDEYNQATEKLTDTNLKGASKSAAIYDQNQTAMDLIMKYNITDYERIGDTIKINEDALQQAQENSIQSMAVSKYAASAAKVKAKEEQNAYQEEKLERETGLDEKGVFGGLTVGAGALAAALMFIPGVNLGVAAAAGIAAGAALITGAGVDYLYDEMRDNSAVDKAVEMTRKTGSTAWMDDESALAESGLNSRQLEKIKEKRKEIESLAASEYAAEQANREQQESVARDIIRTNEQLKDFKHADKLTEGLINEQKDWYENQKEYHWWNSTSKSRIADAKSIESELGLTGSVVWQDDKKNGRLTYTTSDGQTGEVSYDTLSTQLATKEGKAGTDYYIDTMMDTYDTIKAATGNEDAAAGMLSLLSGGDFESATIDEMNAAKELLGDLSSDAYGDFGFYDQYGNQDFNKYSEFAKSLGLTFTEGDSQSLTNALNEYAATAGYENYVDLFNTLGAAQNYSSPILDMMTQFTGIKQDDGTYSGGQYSGWFNNQGQAIFGSMDQATMKEFYKELSYISATQGEDAGLNYLNGLSGILQDVEAEDMGKAIQAMLAVDWDDWDNLDTSIIDTMEEFGVTIDNDSEALKNFVAVVRTTANAIPNLEESMTSLVQAAGSLESVKIGDKISDATMEALKAQGYDLSDETFSTFSGDNVVIGDTEHILKGIRDEVTSTYATYNETRDKVDNALAGKNTEERIDTLRDLSQTEFINGLSQYYTSGGEQVRSNNDAYFMARSILGNDGVKALDDAIAQRQSAQQTLKNYQVDASGNITRYKDESGNWVEFSSVTDANKKAEIQNQYDTAKLNESNAQWMIDQSYESIKAAMDAAQDPAEVQKIAEQYVSTFSSFEDAMANETTREMIERGDLKEEDALKYYASKYPELTEYINAYNDAVANGNPGLIEQAENQMRVGVAMQDALASYTAITGKKADLADLNATITALKNDMDEETMAKYQDKDGNWNMEELAKLAEETMIAGVGWSDLQKNGSSWATEIGYLKNKDATAAQLDAGYAAAGKLGKAMQQYLGLTEYDITGISKQDGDNPIVKAINELNIDLSKILNKDVAETQKMRAYLVSQSTAGKSLSTKLGIGSAGKADEFDQKYGNAGKAYNKMKNAVGEDGALDEAAFEEASSEWADALNAGEVTWEEYSAGIEMASGGRRTALTSGVGSKKTTITRSDGTTGTGTMDVNWKKNGDTIQIQTGRDEATGAAIYEDYDSEVHGDIDFTTESGLDPTKTNYSGGGGGGGGGGGPTKVAVKSAQELMTRYKTIDQKATTAEMQTTLALQQKDLLYGQSKINQLNKINTLLRKQQQLTADRIEEELDYLEKDKEHLQEVLDRYNKDKKDAEGNVKEGEELLEFTFNSEGLITNYKQTVGAMAEELAAMYRDGELTADEGTKAEEIQKKIADLNVVIQDYEDSLNQIATSIEEYENTLYEMLSTEVEAMTHKVEYKIDIDKDDLSYLDFYSSVIKDSIGSVTDYLELMGSKVNEAVSQMGIYEQGYADLMAFVNENPLQLWATQGVEGMLTAEQVTSLRTYRDGLISTYNAAIQVRKEIEEQVMKVFDHWHEKINKNVESISRFTDMLAQFKDIINIVGKDVLGLSDTFMNTFEQKAVNQSLDNIEASRTQYEHLIEVYTDAQEKLEEARARGNERDIEYWEGIVDETQSAMEEAQDAMLTSLNHSLTMIAEQFTNAVTQAIDNFNESLYEFGGLDGLVTDYEQIREQQDLIVEDYEKIYNLNKLNRNIEKTLSDSKLTAGKQKLLEFQQKINELNKNNVELSKYELEYLQAEYELKLAEIELENSRNSKDTVRLSRDSEGNWSYIYTQNEEAVEAAEQKYEDALYKMQQLSRNYTEEMSAAMMEISQQMRDEIAELSIQDFESPEAYEEEVRRIQEKYQEQLAFREAELNKSIGNNSDLYEQDWLNYSRATGYKISADEDWIDSFNETTLGGLIDSTANMSDYSLLIADSIGAMNKALDDAANKYFFNANKAMTTYGSSLKGFGNDVSKTTTQIVDSSKKATKEVSTLAGTLVDEFSKISDTVQQELADWTEKIGNKLEELLATIKQINDFIAESASKELPDTQEIIGQEEAVSRMQKAAFENEDFKKWEWSEEGETAVYKGNDEGWNFVEFNAQLVRQINEALQEYANTPTTDEKGRAEALEKLNKLIKDYWTFKRILEKVYDPTNIKIEELETPDTGDATQMATGGYTGEWGNEGKLAVLHEKELVLSKDDTANFLDALAISKDVINSMIEMNARQSSFALGGLSPTDIPDLSSVLEQQVSIVAEFPDAVYHNEIEEAFDNLMNTASQYANRYKV